ncbi:hypothetical protein OAK91_07285, partial [Planctomycetaceae bacterium]|nr:hypothetical protein [Planctomycetaceae bacterium]
STGDPLGATFLIRETTSRQALRFLADVYNAIVVRIPVKFYRRNGRQMVLTRSENGQAAPERETNGSLVSALAKAYRWQEQLESGEYAGLEDLAAANGGDRTYVGRILRLTSLSPEIVERILNGDEPEGISLRRLQKGVPVAWTEQAWGLRQN